MLFLPANAQRPAAENAVKLPSEAITGLALKGTFERMARRRFQKPKPFLEGNWWWIRIWQDQFTNGRLTRKLKRIKLAPAETKYRDVQREAEAKLQPINQGLETIGSATNFRTYVNDTYIPVVLPLMATSTQSRYRGIINNYLLPAFGQLCLRDLETLVLQRYFSAMTASKLLTNPETRSAT